MNSILFVSGNMQRGGAQRVMSQIANAYAEKGWDVSIAMLLGNEVCYELNKKITIFELVQHGSYYRALLRWIFRLRRLVRQKKPDVIVSFVGRINMITMLANLGTGIPVVVSERNDPAHDRRNKFEVTMCRLFYRLADKIIFQTSYQQRFYGKSCAKHSVIIGNPIAAPFYEGVHNSNDIIAVGKLDLQKNHSMLIQAFSMIAQDHPQVNVHIFGNGGLQEQLQEQIDMLGLHERVFLEGNTNRIFEVMQKYRYFVMCSDYEGLSNALLEAMASGMVCVSTDWSGVEDVLEDGVNGFITPKGDVDALANLLKQIMAKGYSDIAQCAINRAGFYSHENIVEKWMQAVEDVVKK